MFCKLTIRVQERGGPRDLWFVFETDHGSLGDLREDLADAGSLIGRRLDTFEDEGGSRTVRQAREYVLSDQLFVAAEPLDFDLRGAGGDLLARAAA